MFQHMQKRENIPFQTTQDQAYIYELMNVKYISNLN